MILLVFQDVIGWVVEHKRIVVGAIGILIVVTALGGFFVHCSGGSLEADPKGKEEIGITKGRIDETRTQRNTIKEEKRGANENTKRSETNFNTSVNRDSANSNSNFRSVRRKFCREFPEDSRCR